MDTVFIEALEVSAITGVHDWERQLRQRLRLDLALDCDTRAAGQSDALADALDYSAVSDRVRAIAEASDYYLLEALGNTIATTLITEFDVPRVSLTITKPGCVPGARAAGIRLERQRAESQ